MQALVHGETWSLPSNTSHLIRNYVWAWHVIGGKDEIEDKSNCQCDQVRLRLCTEQKAIIIIAISKHRPKECLPPPPKKQGFMESLLADQGRIYWFSKIPVSQVDGREEIPYHYSRAEMLYCWTVTLMACQNWHSQIWSGTPAMQVWMKQVYQWGRKSTLLIMRLELQTPEN